MSDESQSTVYVAFAIESYEDKFILGIFGNEKSARECAVAHGEFREKGASKKFSNPLSGDTIFVIQYPVLASFAELTNPEGSSLFDGGFKMAEAELDEPRWRHHFAGEEPDD